MSRVRAACVYTDEERHLGGEDELVSFEQSPRRVDEDRVRDAVDQVDDALFDLLGRLGAINRLLEHHAECLRTPTHTTRRHRRFTTAQFIFH